MIGIEPTTSAALSSVGVVNPAISNITITGTNGVNSGVVIQSATGTWSLSGVTTSGASDTQAVLINNCSGTGTISNVLMTADAANPGYGINVSNSVMTALTISNCTATGHSRGFYIYGTTSNTTLSNCTASYSPSSDGIMIVGTGTGLLVTQCTAHHNYNDGMSTYLNCTARFTRNLSYNNGTNGVANSGDGFTTHNSPTVVFDNNIAHDNWRDGFGFAMNAGGTISCYNNTAYNNGTSVEPTSGGGCIYTGAGTGGTLNWYNNVCVANYPWEIRYKYGITVNADHNIYYHRGNGVTEASFANIDLTNDSTDNEAVMTWATYHTTNGKEPNSIYGDPLLNSDLSLAQSSLAIAAGAQTAYPVDYVGNNRSCRTFDMGAKMFVLTTGEKCWGKSTAIIK